MSVILALLHFSPADTETIMSAPGQSHPPFDILAPGAQSHTLVLSLFPGLDLLGRGFELNGCAVVRGPEAITGGDIRTFRPIPNRFDGIIGGPPCQDFSKARRCAPSGDGLALLHEFTRVVFGCQPAWWLAENVPAVPDITVPGYITQRLDVLASEFGSAQKRIRHFQFGRRPEKPPLTLPRLVTSPCHTAAAAVASEGKRGRAHRRDFVAFCALQGISPPHLPDVLNASRYKLVGNAVALPVAWAMARAIAAWDAAGQSHLNQCACGCGRVISQNATYARPACRKREERRRRVTPRTVTTPAQSQLAL